MTVKAIVDRLRMAEGYSGAAVCLAGQELFSENIERDYAVMMLRVLRSSNDVRRVSVAARGFTFVSFDMDGYDVLLKLAGRFPPVPLLNLVEPEFVDSPCALALPSKESARQEAETALQEFGLLDN